MQHYIRGNVGNRISRFGSKITFLRYFTLSCAGVESWSLPWKQKACITVSWSLIGRWAKLPTANEMILALPFEKILHRWKMPVAHWSAKDITATKQKSLCFRGHSCTSSPYDTSQYICVCYVWFTVHGLIGQRDNQGICHVLS